jgi:cystathionine beta-lyase/cystathionine gamma-synthase
MEDLGDVEDERLLSVRSEGEAERAQRFEPVVASHPEAELADSIGAELREDAARRLALAILKLEGFLRRGECWARRAWDPTRHVGRTLIDEGRHLLRGALSESALPPSEPTLRSAYRLIGVLGNLAGWSAPATQESHALASFPVAAAQDAVAYSRFGGAEIAAQESVYVSMLGFDAQRARLLLTSSGMTAYALIEAFLLREVLKPADCILLHPSVYFETRQQLVSLTQFSSCTAAGGSRADMLAAIRAWQPRVVFVDPLSNAADFRAIDMTRLLDEADRICQQETWFVVDSTLLSGGFDPFAGSRRERVRVLYYESGCKYLQFGLDLGPAGLVVVESALAESFERLRRGIGAVGSEALVLPRASRQAYLDYLCAQTACAQAVSRAASGACSAACCIIEPVHPSQVSHPDHAEAQCYAHLGGVLVFRFANPLLNRRRPLEDFIDLLIDRARSARLALTAGVSFGFCVPRIGAAWSSYEVDEAFLRLSAGIDLALAAALGRLVVDCAHHFVTKAEH